MHDMTVRVEVCGARDLESGLRVGMAALAAGTQVVVDECRSVGPRVDTTGRPTPRP